MELPLLSILQSQLIEVKIDLYKLILSAIIGLLENCAISLIFHFFLGIFPLVSCILLPFSFCLTPLSCTFPILSMSGVIYSVEIIFCCPLLLCSNALIEFILPLIAIPCFPLTTCGFLAVTIFDLGLGLVGPPFQILSICDTIPPFCSAICPFCLPPLAISSATTQCFGFLSSFCSVICPLLDPFFILVSRSIQSFCFCLPFCPPFCLVVYPIYLGITPCCFSTVLPTECLLALPSHLCAICMGVRATATDLPFRIVRPIALGCRAFPCCYPIGGVASTLGDETMTFWNTCSLSLFQWGILFRDLLLEGEVSEIWKAGGLASMVKELLSQLREIVAWELEMPAYVSGCLSGFPFTCSLLPNFFCLLPRCLLGCCYYSGWLICLACPPLGYLLVCLSALGEEICFAGSSLLMGFGDNLGHLCSGLNRICMCSGWSCFFGAPLPWQVDWGWWKGLCKF